MPKNPELIDKSVKGSLSIDVSVLKLAKSGDFGAISLMFRQFIPENETICFAEYLGVEGIWGLGTHSFGCLTDRRVASISVGPFNEIVYQDGYIDYINSGVIYQPSKLFLYLFGIIFISILFISILFTVKSIIVINFEDMLFGLVGIGLGFFGIPVSAKLFYRFNKCGLVFSIREGVSVYMFANRGKLVKANQLYRNLTELRESRLVKLPKDSLL